MIFPIKFDTVKSGRSIVYIEWSQVILFKKKLYCFSEDQLLSCSLLIANRAEALCCLVRVFSDVLVAFQFSLF